jgi:hypothetical protein
MSFVLWDDTLDVGVAVFNGDHRRLVEFINELHSAMVPGFFRFKGRKLNRAPRYRAESIFFIDSPRRRIPSSMRPASVFEKLRRIVFSPPPPA